MKTINKKGTNVVECKCGTVIEYDGNDLTLREVENTGCYVISVKCPSCEKAHIVKPHERDDNKLIASVARPNELNEYPFADISFTAIKTICDEGFAEKYFKVGMTKEIALKDGTTATIEIAGLNHDTKEDGSVAPITFIFRDLLGTSENGGRVMNREWTNVGGWDKSEMRKYLNEDFIALLPDELVACIAPVSKLAANKGEKGEVIASVDKIFIPSEVEVFGEVSYSYKGEGKQYEIFKSENWKNRIKGYADGTCGRWWWLRSPYSGSSNRFCMVYGSGTANGYGANNGNGVSPCFAF